MTGPLPDATARYAGHQDAVVDLHLPAGSLPTGPDTPLVVLLHGGFWKQEWDRRHTRPMARALAERGLVVATPEYRRVRGRSRVTTCTSPYAACRSCSPGWGSQPARPWSRVTPRAAISHSG